MKKLSFILLTIILITSYSCNNIKGSQEETSIQLTEGDDATEQTTDQAEPEYLTYETFLEKVWDFESNPQEWVYKGDVPCVIDFYADWCRPCKMVAPIMDDLAKEYDGKVKIYKINTDKEKRLAQAFQIRSIPAVLFSPMEGRPVMQVGAMQKDQYVKIIEENLLNNTTTK
ncbi:MAG: thioredoxin [Bacteroidetes bacterium]|nr:MAG: thioredoxin [Bacteroidota bacterium]